MATISKLNLNGVSYDIEDSSAQSSINSLTTDLTSEVSNRQTAVNSVQSNLDSEITRAKAAESANTTAIDALNTKFNNLDTALYMVVDSLPTSDQKTNKIYLVKNSTSGENNVYIEYIWKGDAFEELGRYEATVDLSAYLKSSDAASTYETQSALTANYYTKTEVDSKVGNKITATVSDETLTLTIN